MSEAGNLSQEELDLKELILALLKKWYVILIFTIIGAGSVYVYSLFHKYVPTYSATAVIQMSDPNLTEFVLKDDNKALVAEKLGIEPKSVYTPSLTQQSGDKSLFNLTIQSTDASKAKTQVNAWAEVAVEQVKASILDGAQSAIDKAQASVEGADFALVQFLEDNGLSSLTWVELENLTGVISNSNFMPSDSQVGSSQEAVVLSETQRLQLAELMRQKVAAEQTYQNVATSNLKIISQNAENDYFLVSYANWTKEISDRPKVKRNITLGGFIGLIFSIIGLSIIYWWIETGKPRSHESKIN
jgi:capsular polysaccharide biosynthesis protein